MRLFVRLLAFLRPYRRGVIVSFVLAAAAMGTGVLIPYFIGRTVDDLHHGGPNLWPLALGLTAAGVLRLVFSVARRLVAGRVSLGVEFDLRNRMYEHLQSLELAFFHSQQTGHNFFRTWKILAVQFGNHIKKTRLGESFHWFGFVDSRESSYFQTFVHHAADSHQQISRAVAEV